MAVADQRNLNAKASLADIAAEVENNWRESVMKLALAHEISAKMIHGALHKDLKLSQKSTRWVTKMLYEKKERVRVCEVIMVMIAATS